MKFPVEDDVTNPSHISVFSFPIKSPGNAVHRSDRTAIEQLTLWATYADHWCEHKPSVTISVREQEWMEVGAWVYKNFDKMSGVSFLPFSDHTYRQAPYQDCDETTYKKTLKSMPKNIDWASLTKYELEDTTEGHRELACAAGFCEIV